MFFCAALVMLFMNIESYLGLKSRIWWSMLYCVLEILINTLLNHMFLKRITAKSQLCLRHLHAALSEALTCCCVWGTYMLLCLRHLHAAVSEALTCCCVWSKGRLVADIWKRQERWVRCCRWCAETEQTKLNCKHKIIES